jgi:hypothetical protein
MNTQKYYSKTTSGFYDSAINTEMPDDVVAISDEKYEELLLAINSGCKVFDDLTVSEPKPSVFHKWDGLKWIEDIDARKQYIKDINQSKISELTQEATQKIAILEDAIDLGMAEDGDADKIKQWRKYRVLLSQIDSMKEDLDLPVTPS